MAFLLDQCETSYEEMERALEVLKSMPQKSYALAEEMLDFFCPATKAATYCYHVVHFVRQFSKIEGVEVEESQMRFWLIDLADYCIGLPATERIATFFRTVYDKYPCPRLKAAAAECLGNMRDGLPPASPLFLGLLFSADAQTRCSAAEALARVLRTQSELVKEAGEWGERFCALHASTIEQLTALRAELSSLPQEDRVVEVLRQAGCLSDLDVAVGAQIKDEQSFLSNRDMLLAEHNGEYVAIWNGEIVGFAKTPKAIDRLINKKLGPDARAFVAKITPEAFGPAPTAIIF